MLLQLCIYLNFLYGVKLQTQPVTPRSPAQEWGPIGVDSVFVMFNAPYKYCSSWCNCKITFYEGKYFTGRKLEVFGSCDNFQDRGFMNRVNSICVQSGAWICFDHPDFRGQQYVLEHGEYPDFYRWNGYNDHMGSCRPVGMHGAHYRMEIFDGSHFSGDCMEFTEDCSFLQGKGWNKNCVNAIKVYGDGAWVLYEEPNYRGRMYVVERGEYNNFNAWQAQSANIQSIRRVVNYF